ncbi:MAG: hypothetical protein IJ307_05785 [Bacteroidales bacterium]|nr:hypothetical protein [Bacteroidales bacterium]
MELSTFKIAEQINSKKDYLKEQLKHIDAGAWRLGCKLELKTGYAEMGRDLTTTAEFKEDVTEEICKAVKDVIIRRIEALEAEFKEL